MQDTLYGFPIRQVDRRRSDNRKAHDIQRLWDRQHEILELNSMGYKGTEIAKMLGVHPVTVSNCLNSTLGSEVAHVKREDREKKYEGLRDEVLTLTEKALKVYHRIFDEPEESGKVSIKMQKETADTVMLELSGMRAAQKLESRSISTVLTAEELAEFKKRGMEAARASGKLVEVSSEA